MSPRGAAPVTAPPPPPGAEQAEGYRVQLPTFEGPLDLLLHLIQEHELDIMDIPVGFVAERYVAYVTLMQEVNIDLASEYLVMAATLAHIKSRMLLPTPPEDQDDPDAEPEEDPRAELVRRLLEYQKYKDAAEQLAERSIQGRDVFGRGAPTPTVEGPAPLAPISLFKLLDAFQSVLERTSKTVGHEIEFDRLSITERISELCDLLRSRPRWLFHELFDDQRTRAEVIITFLALLEMTRLRLTRLVQEGPLEPIEVLPTLGDDVPSKAGVDDVAATPPALEASADAGAPEAAARAERSAEPGPGLLDVNPGAEDEPRLQPASGRIASDEAMSSQGDSDEASEPEPAPGDAAVQAQHGGRVPEQQPAEIAVNELGERAESAEASEEAGASVAANGEEAAPEADVSPEADAVEAAPVPDVSPEADAVEAAPEPEASAEAGAENAEAEAPTERAGELDLAPSLEETPATEAEMPLENGGAAVPPRADAPGEGSESDGEAQDAAQEGAQEQGESPEADTH